MDLAGERTEIDDPRRTVDDLRRQIDELQRTVDELCGANTELQESVKRYRFLAEHSIDVTWQIDSQFRFTYVSPTVEKMLGYRADEMLGRTLFSILTPESVDKIRRGYAERQYLQKNGHRWPSTTYEVAAMTSEGRLIWVEVSVNPVFDDVNRLIGYNGITRDVTERRRHQEIIRQYAFQDPLTMLPNRRLFQDELNRAIIRCRSLDQPLAVMFLDLDGLKEVNDGYGHAAGDRLLQTVATRLREAVRDGDIVARLGGDEFMIVLPGLGDIEAIDQVATRISAVCRQPIAIGDGAVEISASIGISFFPADANDIITLMNFADAAMYRAKETGRGNIVCYGQL